MSERDCGAPRAGVLEGAGGVVDLGDHRGELPLVGDHPLLLLEVLELELVLLLLGLGLSELLLELGDPALALLELVLPLAVLVLQLDDLGGCSGALLERVGHAVVDPLQANHHYEILMCAFHLSPFS